MYRYEMRNNMVATSRFVLRLSLCLIVLAVVGLLKSAAGNEPSETAGLWQKHRVQEGFQAMTAIAADFSGDGKPDVISNNYHTGETKLFVAPDWQEVLLHVNEDHKFIHSECYDIDKDGDQDYIGARYNPGLVVWLECPAEPLTGRWQLRLIDDQIHGIHGVIQGDVDNDGVTDLLATSAQPLGLYPSSLAWFRTPRAPRTAQRWQRYIFAEQDAPGLTHYLGFGDVNGDGRPDAATGAKGGSSAEPGTGNWFAWWESPQDPRSGWKKHDIALQQPGATNIHPADVNGDGQIDFIASRGHGHGVVWFEAPNWELHEIHPTLKEPHCLAIVDMDGDGDIDAATCAFGDKIAAWFENDGKGNFTIHVVGRNQEAYDIRAVDLDGDGDVDLLVAGRDSNNVIWYENPKKMKK